ncbi:hypothetical protein HD554DRAFT_2175206 [Boletus coccyginus]|nr:hypothetical protein HD554DRAFT_2175206 [Boletus coccyginus]
MKNVISLTCHLEITPTIETVRYLDYITNCKFTHTPILNSGNYDFSTFRSSHLPIYKDYKSDSSVRQLSLFFSATFGLDMPTYKDAMEDNLSSLLNCLYQPIEPAVLIQVDDEDFISIHSGQAEAGEFYTIQDNFYAQEEEEFKMAYEAYFDLDGGYENEMYVFSSFLLHPSDTDVQLPYSPYCENHNAKEKGKTCEQKEDAEMWLLNSGALAHFINNFDVFIKYQVYTTLYYMQTANGKVPVLGKGSVLIHYKKNIVEKKWRKAEEEAKCKAEEEAEAQCVTEAERARREVKEAWRAEEAAKRWSSGKGKVQQALPECTRCTTQGLECELRPSKSTSCMGCIEVKAKCKQGGAERTEGRGKRKRWAEGRLSRGKAKKARPEVWRLELDRGEGGSEAAKTAQVSLQLPTEFGYWMQCFLKWLNRQNQLLESLMELKEEELYGMEEKELEEEFLQDEEVVAKELARLMAEEMEEVSEDEGELGGSEKGLEE